MRKSLGEKRRYLTDEQIAETTRLHGSLDEGEFSKLVPVEQFGYRTIVVDRPLRARWEIGEQTWAGVEEEKAVGKLEQPMREALVAALGAIAAVRFDGEDACRVALRAALGAAFMM